MVEKNGLNVIFSLDNTKLYVSVLNLQTTVLLSDFLR